MAYKEYLKIACIAWEELFVWLRGQNAILWNFGAKMWFWAILGSKCDFEKFYGQNVILGEFGVEMWFWEKMNYWILILKWFSLDF